MNRSLCNSIPKKSKKIFGSGGSKTVIIITPDNKVYKYFMVFSHKDSNDRSKNRKLKQFELEINIQKYLTKNIVNKNLSPHIAKLEDSLFCNKKPDFLFEGCPSFTKLLTKKSKKNLPKECMYLIQGYPVKIEKGFLIANIEYCPFTLNEIIKKLMRKSNKKVEHTLNKIIFQIVFTLAVIQKKYPYFVHHDLFIRNILAKEIIAKKNDYIRYHFGRYIFDVPAAGYICKITDFGLTNLNKRDYSTPKLVKSPYEDIFNIIYDIYNGANLGSESCLSIAKKRKNTKKEQFLHKYFSNFINTKLIQRIDKNKQKRHIDWNWRMFYDPKISELFNVKLPSEYLKQFIKIYPTCEKHNIIHTYGL